MAENVRDVITKTVIFYRNERGIGDACMLLPTIEKYQQSGYETIIVMDEPTSAIFKHTKTTIIPVEKFDIVDYDKALFFNVSHCCLDYELQKRYKLDKSRFDIFASHCNTTVDARGEIVITDAEIRHIYDRMPVLSQKANGYKIVGIVLKSMQPWRNYPHIRLLAEYFNRTPFLDNTTKYIIPVIIDNEETIDGFTCTNDLDIRETIAFISQLDLVIGIDTGPMHIAGTLNIPTLWIFGPTDPRLRVLYYPKAEYLWKPCIPEQACWYDYCAHLNCLWKISPWKVARRAKKILYENST